MSVAGAAVRVGCMTTAGLLLLAWANLAAGQAGSSAPQRPVLVGPDTRAWLMPDAAETSAPGAPKPFTNSAPRPRVLEWSTGMNYWDTAAQQWAPSDASVEPIEGGFLVSKVQHVIRLSADLNVRGAASVRTPDGVQLSSTPVAIALYSPKTGQSAIIGALTNSLGALAAGTTNCVVYENAFRGVCASVVYRVTPFSFEQDIVFTGAIDPAAYGFSPAEARIQLITELYDTPAPQVISRPVYVEKDPAVRNQMAGSPDIIDQTLGFGEFVLGAGHAYTTPVGVQPQGGAAPVAKQYVVTDDGRAFIVESVPFTWISNALAVLPSCPSGGSQARTYQHGLTELLASIPSSPTKADLQAAGRATGVQLARAVKMPLGLTMDWVGTIGGTLNSATLFACSTNFLISGTVVCNGAVTVEGGAVLKYKKGAGIYLNNTLTLKTDRYRPAVFSCVDDDGVGMSMTNVPGSGYTGTIDSAGYANPALSIPGGNVKLSNCRFSYAQVAVQKSDPSGLNLTILDSQFMKCVRGVNLVNSGSGAGTGVRLKVQNVLMSGVQYPLTFPVNYSDTACSLENCTLDQVTQLISGGEVTTGSTNSIYANITSLGQSCSGAYNAFYASSSAQFGSSQFSLSSSPFVAVGGGSYYLTNSSGLIGVGSAAIDSALLADLCLKTVFPPLVYTAANTYYIGANTVLCPVVQRDTSALPSPGYHYDPIDHAFPYTWITNATLTVTPGTVLTLYATPSPNLSGLVEGPGGALLCQGTPTDPVRITQYSAVQERSTSTWQPGSGQSCAFIMPQSGSGLPAASVNCRFVDFSSLATDWAHAGQSGGDVLPLKFQDCQFHGGRFEVYGTAVNMTNCVLERVDAGFMQYDSYRPIFRNNLFIGGYFDFLPLTTSDSLIQDNLFDRTWLPDDLTSYGYAGGNNAL